MRVPPGKEADVALKVSAESSRTALEGASDAVKQLARQTDLVLVLGSPTSSNANRLAEVARNQGTESRLIEDATDIDPRWLDGIAAVGLTAGASTPETLVAAAIARLQELGCGEVRDLVTTEEYVTFPLPRELRESPPLAPSEKGDSSLFE